MASASATEELYGLLKGALEHYVGLLTRLKSSVTTFNV
jgi:hypothetical protein